MDTPVLNTHDKIEYEPAHSCEHILNRTMVTMFGCPRSKNTHIEKKKSKCDYILDSCPTDEQVAAIENKVNEIISLFNELDIESKINIFNEEIAIINTRQELIKTQKL